MMQGIVNQSCEATIPLVISNVTRQTQLINAVIDTGFTGYLSLSREIIEALKLPWTGIDRGTLGDGSEVTFEVYAVTVIWDGQYRDIPVNEAETDPLIGMSLLYGYDLPIVRTLFKTEPETRILPLEFGLRESLKPAFCR